jgi:hypothetical protein
MQSIVSSQTRDPGKITKILRFAQDDLLTQVRFLPLAETTEKACRGGLYALPRAGINPAPTNKDIVSMTKGLIKSIRKR